MLHSPRADLLSTFSFATVLFYHACWMVLVILDLQTLNETNMKMKTKTKRKILVKNTQAAAWPPPWQLGKSDVLANAGRAASHTYS